MSVSNILDLKDYYLHQQNTQSVLINEIKELEQEKEDKRKKTQELKELLSFAQIRKKGNLEN